jgi:hypothetical protein
MLVCGPVGEGGQARAEDEDITIILMFELYLNNSSLLLFFFSYFSSSLVCLGV